METENAKSAQKPLPLPDLRRETTLDRRHTPPAPTAVARNEIQPVLALAQLRVRTPARLARDVLHDVPPQHVLDLFLLEATLDDEAFAAVDGAAGAQLGEEELRDVLVVAVHALADLRDVGEDRLLVAFAEALRGWDLVGAGAG